MRSPEADTDNSAGYDRSQIALHVTSYNLVHDNIHSNQCKHVQVR